RQTPAGSAPSLAAPAASALPAQKSSDPLPLLLPSALLPTSPPTSVPHPSAPLPSPAPTARPPSLPPALSGSPSHWAAAATPPPSHNSPGPCAPAASTAHDAA